MEIRRMSNASLVLSRRLTHRLPRLRCPLGFLHSKYRPHRLPAGQIIPMEAVRHILLVQLMVYMDLVLQRHRNWLIARPPRLRPPIALRMLRETLLLLRV